MNDILFGNHCHALFWRLAKADFKAHKLKTLLMVSVIALASGLMTSVISILVNDALTRMALSSHHKFSMDVLVIAGLVFFAAFLIFVSSFVIYSIFYISMVHSMPMYTKLITLGTTKGQLKAFLRIQGNLLALYGIPAGLVVSLALICLLFGTKWLLYDLSIALVSGFLMVLAIKAALRKPLALLLCATPIEAMKSPGKTFEKRMSVLSLAISGTLILAVAALFSSVYIPGLLTESFPLQEDFQISLSLDHFYQQFPDIVSHNPLSHDLEQKILAIPGVERLVKQETLTGQLTDSVVVYVTPEGNLERLESLSPELWQNIQRFVSGETAYENLKPDEIIINQYLTDHSQRNYSQIQVGDVLTFQFEENGILSQHRFLVAGIAYFPSTGLFYTLPETIHRLSSGNHAVQFSIFCAEEQKEQLKQELTVLSASRPNLQLASYSDTYSLFQTYLNLYLGSFYSISLIVLLFSLFHMVGILINSVLVRKREFALLQAVGMTSRQLRRKLYGEGIAISAASALLSAGTGTIIGWLLCGLINRMTGLPLFRFRLPLASVFLFAVLVMGLQMAVSFLLCRITEKVPLTERLRVE